MEKTNLHDIVIYAKNILLYENRKINNKQTILKSHFLVNFNIFVYATNISTKQITNSDFSHRFQLSEIA